VLTLGVLTLRLVVPLVVPLHDEDCCAGADVDGRDSVDCEERVEGTAAGVDAARFEPV